MEKIVISDSEHLIEVDKDIYEVVYKGSIQIEGNDDKNLESIKLNSGHKLISGCEFRDNIVEEIFLGDFGGVYVKLAPRPDNYGYRRKNKYRTVIAVDFDGTIVTHEYPNVGKPLKLAKEVLNMLTCNGNDVFLYTMRDGAELEDAKRYCVENGINMCGYNHSPQQFSSSPKQYAMIYIDDAALGCPLDYDPDYSRRPFVNWFEVAKYLASMGLITQDQLDSLRKV
jgi:hypothetical protein